MTSPLHPDTKALLLDTETTDIKDPEIVEVAWAEYGDDCKYVIADTDTCYSRYFGYEREMAWGALNTHHILPSELEGLQTAKAALELPPVKYIIGHNIDFDWEALGKPPVMRICTLALARAIWPKLDSKSNGAVYYYLHRHSPADLQHARAMLRNAHSALADIGITATILEAIVARLKPRNLAHLYEMSEAARIPRIMSFGKHKDRPVLDVDNGYRAWYRKQEDPDPYLLAAWAGAKPLEVPGE